MDFMGQLATYARCAAHAKAEQTRHELAKELGRIAKPMRKIVRESITTSGGSRR